jgi:hypothetical protein
MKIYVAAVKALRKKERRDETQFTTKIGGTRSSEIKNPTWSEDLGIRMIS